MDFLITHVLLVLHFVLQLGAPTSALARAHAWLDFAPVNQAGLAWTALLVSWNIVCARCSACRVLIGRSLLFDAHLPRWQPLARSCALAAVERATWPLASANVSLSSAAAGANPACALTTAAASTGSAWTACASAARSIAGPTAQSVRSTTQTLTRPRGPACGGVHGHCRRCTHTQTPILPCVSTSLSRPQSPLAPLDDGNRNVQRQRHGHQRPMLLRRRLGGRELRDTYVGTPRAVKRISIPPFLPSHFPTTLHGYLSSLLSPSSTSGSTQASVRRAVWAAAAASTAPASATPAGRVPTAARLRARRTAAAPSAATACRLAGASACQGGKASPASPGSAPTAARTTAPATTAPAFARRGSPGRGASARGASARTAWSAPATACARVRVRAFARTLTSGPAATKSSALRTVTAMATAPPAAACAGARSTSWACPAPAGIASTAACRC
jgi:hypothetical protein